MRWIFFFFALLAASVAQAQPSAQEMCSLASSLTKLAKAVDGFVSQNEAAAATMRGNELLQTATKNDPGLLVPFRDYFIEARAKGRNSSVQVCSSDQSRGLLEDAGCSPQADVHRWQHQPLLECGFTLNLEEICVLNPPRARSNPCR